MTKVHFTLPPLGYTYDALEPAYAHELLELHHADHHRAYVEGANRALEDLADMRAGSDYRHINQLQKDLAFNLSGHVLHSILWRNLEPNDGALPTGRLETGIRASFGSFDRFRHQFSAAGAALQGSGWVTLAWEPTQGMLLIEQIHDHQDNFGIATMPLLVMDMWEHAYYLQYSNRKELWILSFWDLINWGNVGRRLENAMGTDFALDPVLRKNLYSVVTLFRRDRP